MQLNNGQAPNTFAGYTSAPGTAHNSTSRQRRRERRNPSLRSVEPALQQRFQQGIDQAQRQPLNINESQHYRVPVPAPPTQSIAGRHANPTNVYSQPYALPPPAAPFQAFIMSPADASRARGASMAAEIRKGVFDDGQPLDPELQTPSKAATHRRSNSVQFTTPNRGQHSGRGRTYSLGSNATVTPYKMQMVQFDGTPTRNAPDPVPLADRLLPGETVPPPDWYGLGKMPTLQQAMASIPFTDPTAGLRIKPCGVIKLEGISFKCTRSEILEFLGLNAEVVHMPEG
jgi:hypothetical protein